MWLKHTMIIVIIAKRCLRLEEIIEKLSEEFEKNVDLDEILNRKIRDNILTYDKVFSWGEFEITDIKFYKKITDTYYSYIVNIKVNNREADVSGLSDKNLSTSEYYIVSVKFYFVYDNDSISIKNVEYNK